MIKEIKAHGWKIWFNRKNDVWLHHCPGCAKLYFAKKASYKMKANCSICGNNFDHIIACENCISEANYNLLRQKLRRMEKEI